MKEKLIRAGIRNLKEFGYPDVNDENILTDLVYSQFFLSMLEENKGNGFDEPINALIEEIKKNKQQ